MRRLILLLGGLAVVQPVQATSPRWVVYLRDGGTVHRYDATSVRRDERKVTVLTSSIGRGYESSTTPTIDCAAQTVSYRELSGKTPGGAPMRIYLSAEARAPKPVKGTSFAPLAKIFCKNNRR